MYLRMIQWRNKDGSLVCYVPLVHNKRHPEPGNSVARVVHSFGREGQLDRECLSRLVASISHYVGPVALFRLLAEPDGDSGDGELAFVSCQQLGGTWVRDGLWRRLGIDELIRTLLVGRRGDPMQVERVLFALVANRALDPCSKLAAIRWVGEIAHVLGLQAMDDDACYRAMDVLTEIEDELAQQVFWQVTALLDREVDRVFSIPPRLIGTATPPTTPWPAIIAVSRWPTTAPRRWTGVGSGPGGIRTSSVRTASPSSRLSQTVQFDHEPR